MVSSRACAFARHEHTWTSAICHLAASTPSKIKRLKAGTSTLLSTSVVTQTPSPPAPLCSDAANPYIFNGKSYTVYCDRASNSGTQMGAATVDTLSACIEICVATPGCICAAYVSSASNYSDKLTCYTFSAFKAASLFDTPGVSLLSLDM